VSETYANIAGASGVPTGLGLVRGPESAPTANMTTPNRATTAAANDAKWDRLANTPDPCYCGCCDMTRSAI
jgi:hypothetical protein